MRLVSRILRPRVEATAHCDLPCGVYDPAQARIEAESIKAVQEKYQANEDPEFRERAVLIKEQRSELVKHHLWVLWTDYFKPPHFEKYPELHDLFNRATKAAGAGGTSLRVPEINSSFTFVLEGGAGLAYFVTDKVAVNFGYRFQHISNGNTSSPNRGFNSDSGVIGVSYFLK